MSKAVQKEDGKWYVDNHRFATKEGAESYSQSRQIDEDIETKKNEDAKKRATIRSNIIILTIILSVFYWMWPSSTSKQSSGSSSSESYALMRCQNALKAASRDSSNAVVPFVVNNGSGAEYYFAWGASTKPVRMRNGFGAEVEVGASCIFDKVSGTIQQLTLNGETLK